MKLIYISMLIIWIAAAPARCFGCETTAVSVTGNIDSRSSVASAPPFTTGTTTFSSLQSSAQFAINVQVVDAIGAPHNLTLFLFHTQVSPVGTVVVYLVADATDAGGAPPGYPVLLSQTMFDFGSDGNRVVYVPPDLSAEPLWVNGSRQGDIYFDLSNLTHRPAAAIAEVSQNGGVGGCSQRSIVDFDGDGTTDFSIWRPASGMWAVLKSSLGNSDFLWKQWGLPGDHPIAGDYTGDGKADLVVWRPSNGTWYVCKSDFAFDCSQPSIQQFGLPGDRPMRGDYDGDGVLDFAVWRPAFGFFIFKASRSGAVVVRQWGLPTDIPIDTDPNE